MKVLIFAKWACFFMFIFCAGLTGYGIGSGFYAKAIINRINTAAFFINYFTFSNLIQTEHEINLAQAEFKKMMEVK